MVMGMTMVHLPVLAAAPTPPPDGPPAPVLIGIAVSGSGSVDEGAEAQYTCTATYSDGSTGSVSALWSVDAATASINSDGLLTVGDIDADDSVLVSAVYGGISASLSVSLNDVVAVLSGLTITGPSALDEGTAAEYSCTATWSDGSTATVTPTWNEDSSYASIGDDGVLSAANVASDQSVTITAVYEGLTDTHVVTVNYVAPVLVGITISGPASLDEKTTASFTCSANWSDGATTAVSPVWSDGSPFASISSDGVLSAADVDCSQTFDVTASYGGLMDVCSVTINDIAPVMTGLSIVGASEVKENSTNSFVCMATYSDGSAEEVQPEWSVNASSVVSIDSDGVLWAGNIAADTPVTVSASYDDCSVSQSVAVQVVGTQIIYPLSGYEGETLWARLWDESAQEWIDLGEMTDPDELVIEAPNTAQWYWISIKVYNASSDTWVPEQANWLWM